MILTSFHAALQRSVVTSQAVGLGVGVTTALMTQPQTGILAGLGAMGTAGALTLARSWASTRDSSDRLHRIVNGEKRPRMIGSNRPNAPHSFNMDWDFRSRPIRLHYFEAGLENAAAGTILLVPGFASNAYQWNLIFDELADRYHVIAIDLPGHGYSSCLEHHDYDFASVLPFLLNDFLDLKKLQDVTVIGSSLGGGISQIWASGNPRIKQLILFGSSGCTGEIEHVAFFIRAAILADDFTSGPPPFFFEKLATLWTLWQYVHPSSQTFGSHDVEEFARPYREDPPKIQARADYARQIQDLSIHRSTQSKVLALQRGIRQPVLIVYSEADRAVPVSVPRALSRLIDNSRVLWIPSDQVPTAGHTLMSDTPDLALKIIEDVMTGKFDLSPETKKQHCRVQVEDGAYQYVPGFQIPSNSLP